MCNTRMNSKEINLTDNSYIVNVRICGKQGQSQMGNPHVYLGTVLDLDICWNSMHLLI